MRSIRDRRHQRSLKRSLMTATKAASRSSSYDAGIPALERPSPVVVALPGDTFDCLPLQTVSPRREARQKLRLMVITPPIELRFQTSSPDRPPRVASEPT